MAAAMPDLVVIRAGLRRLQLYLLEKVANAQAAALVVASVPVAELAEYAKAVSLAIVELGATEPAPPPVAASTQAQINAAIEKMISESNERAKQPHAPTRPSGS